jgi:hypothetical protein
MSKTPPIEKQIEDALEFIEIDTIHKAMHRLDWEWHPEKEVPTKRRIRETLEYLLNCVLASVHKNPDSSPGASTGGFFVSWNGGTKLLTVHFSVSHYEWMA